MNTDVCYLIRRLALVASLATVLQAQETAPTATDTAEKAPETEGALLELDTFVVTAVARSDQSQLESSVSVSLLPMGKMYQFTPRNTAELFHFLPGTGELQSTRVRTIPDRTTSVSLRYNF